MEHRAGATVEKVAASQPVLLQNLHSKQEMKDIACDETLQAEATMEILHPDLGVALHPDSSPSLRAVVQSCSTTTHEGDWTDSEHEELTSAYITTT